MGEATVREAQAALKDKADPAHNTVLSILRTLTKKGYVSHRKHGRAFIIAPSISESQAHDEVILALMRALFGASPRAFAQHLVPESEIAREDMDALMDEILKAERAAGSRSTRR